MEIADGIKIKQLLFLQVSRTDIPVMGICSCYDPERPERYLEGSQTMLPCVTLFTLPSR